jgi:hypothetical protein
VNPCPVGSIPMGVRLHSCTPHLQAGLLHHNSTLRAMEEGNLGCRNAQHPKLFSPSQAGRAIYSNTSRLLAGHWLRWQCGVTIGVSATAGAQPYVLVQAEAPCYRAMLTCRAGQMPSQKLLQDLLLLQPACQPTALSLVPSLTLSSLPSQ